MYIYDSTQKHGIVSKHEPIVGPVAISIGVLLF